MEIENKIVLIGLELAWW